MARRFSPGVLGLGTATPAVLGLSASGPPRSDLNVENADTDLNATALEPRVLGNTTPILKATDSDTLDGGTRLAARLAANRQSGQRSAGHSPTLARRKSTRYTRKDFITLAASAGAGGLLFGGLPARRAAAHAGMPDYITKDLEHQTYDMFTEWFAWLRRA